MLEFARKIFQRIVIKRGRAQLRGIPAVEFARLHAQLLAQGWTESSRYGGHDAGIDYDFIRLRKDGAHLKWEWCAQLDWSLEGPHALVRGLAADVGRTVRPAPRFGALTPAWHADLHCPTPASRRDAAQTREPGTSAPGSNGTNLNQLVTGENMAAFSTPGHHQQISGIRIALPEMR